MTALAWMDKAACVGADPELFFTTKTGAGAQAQIAEAARICARCPVTAQCEELRRAAGATDGVWAGRGHNQGDAYKHQGPRPFNPAKCGTPGNAKAHRRHGEHPCRACLDAENAQKRQWEAAQRGTLTEKHCPVCDLTKPAGEFSAGSGMGGLFYCCRACRSERHRQTKKAAS